MWSALRRSTPRDSSTNGSMLPPRPPRSLPCPSGLPHGSSRPVLRVVSRAEVQAPRRSLARARGAARRWRICEESEGRGTQTFKLAQFLLVELGLDAETTYQILATEYNPRLPQPYNEALLRRKVSEAQRSRVALVSGSQQREIAQVSR